MTAAGLADRGFELAKRVGELGGSSDEMLTVACGCLHAALIATGDRDSAALVGKIVQRDDTPDVGPHVALEFLRPVHPDRAGVRPFDHPTHWGAFAVVGRDEV